MMSGSLCTLFLEITAHGLDIAPSGGSLMLRGKNSCDPQGWGLARGRRLGAGWAQVGRRLGAQPLQNMNFLGRGNASVLALLLTARDS